MKIVPVERTNFKTPARQIMREQEKTSSIEPVGHYYQVVRKPESILVEVLSYFPEQAELFSAIQDYAADTTGVRELQFNVYHREAGMGFDWKIRFEAGEFEDLDLYGNIGQHLLAFISEIKILRGEKHPERPYTGSAAVIENILKVADTPDKGSLEVRDGMIAKLLEVMDVGEEDISLMREYKEAIEERTQLMNQVYDLQKKVDKLPPHREVLLTEKIRVLRRQADKVVRDMVGKIEARYPRKRSFGKI